MVESIAVVQMRVDPGGKLVNLERSVAFIRQAAAQGARLVILPELCCTEYMALLREPWLAAFAAESLETGPSVAAWTRVCREQGVHVVAGLVEQGPGGLYNSAAVVGPGGLVGVYRKAHLFDGEKELFLPGDTGFPVFDLPIGRVGVLICYDLRFVEAARILGLQGAEILAVPTTWTDLHKPAPWDDRGWCMADYMALAHAYTNRFYVACANRVGGEGDVRYLGCSLVVDPGGKVLGGPAGPDKEAVLTAPVPIAAARSKGLGGNDLWEDRRTDLYADLLGYLPPVSK